MENEDSSIRCDLCYREEVNGVESQRCPSSSPLLQRKLGFLSCIIVFLVLGGGAIGNQGVSLAAGAGITLPVSRSFSKMEGSGTAEGEFGGMTEEHHQQLQNHDRKRAFLHHGRVLSTTIVDFPLAGNDHEIGLYYTEIELGTPSSQYFLQVDTGSDLTWVNCRPCLSCPTETDLPITLRLYNPGSSSTSSNSSCSSYACSASVEIGGGSCVDNSCYFNLRYGDGSTSTGYLVQDTMTYETGHMVNQTMSTASAKIVLGCSFNQTGNTLTSTPQSTDGIMGFGRAPLSVVTQLTNLGKTTNMFAHCLQGDTGEGGFFIIGEVQEPGIVYTDLVPEQYHYNVVLESISVGGTKLNVPSSVFDVSGLDTGTIFDSGTTLALLVDEAYDAFVQQLTNMVLPTTYLRYTDGGSTPCYQVQTQNLASTFPTVTLNFAGASMTLGPTNYLYQQRADSSYLWCFAWTKSSESHLYGLTILGDIVLKNKLVVYDLQNSRLGWLDYNCQSSVKVSNGTAQEVLYPEGFNSAPRISKLYHPIVGAISTAVLICVTAFL